VSLRRSKQLKGLSSSPKAVGACSFIERRPHS